MGGVRRNGEHPVADGRNLVESAKKILRRFRAPDEAIRGVSRSAIAVEKSTRGLDGLQFELIAPSASPRPATFWKERFDHLTEGPKHYSRIVPDSESVRL
jgi:hypothetical protein